MYSDRQCSQATALSTSNRISCVSLRADDYAPPGAKSKWLAAFYLCIPVGYALVRSLSVASLGVMRLSLAYVGNAKQMWAL